MTTIDDGSAVSPSRISIFPPRTRYRPPCLAMMEGTVAPYFSIQARSRICSRPMAYAAMAHPPPAHAADVDGYRPFRSRIMSRARRLRHLDATRLLPAFENGGDDAVVRKRALARILLRARGGAVS